MFSLFSLLLEQVFHALSAFLTFRLRLWSSVFHQLGGLFFSFSFFIGQTLSRACVISCMSLSVSSSIVSLDQNLGGFSQVFCDSRCLNWDQLAFLRFLKRTVCGVSNVKSYTHGHNVVDA